MKKRFCIRTYASILCAIFACLFAISMVGCLPDGGDDDDGIVKPVEDPREEIAVRLRRKM